jgi:hypothetical protein
MAVRGSGAAVTIATRSLWRLRLAHGAPRYLLYATCAAGLLASVRFALDPPLARAPVTAAHAVAAPDRAAEAYASLFARRYLSWDAAEPQLSEQQLAPMLGTEAESNAGMTLPITGEQRVAWTEVVQSRQQSAATHVYTVAAQTDTAGLVYLAVNVVRRADGRLALSGDPAFVGAPAAAPSEPVRRSHEVTDPDLAGVVERALRNYLAGLPNELAADLSAGAQVAVPSLALTLESVQRIDWSPDMRSVLAVVQARDARGTRYTLAYEVDVAKFGGRWEVSAIEVNPDE